MFLTQRELKPKYVVDSVPSSRIGFSHAYLPLKYSRIL